MSIIGLLKIYSSYLNWDSKLSFNFNRCRRLLQSICRSRHLDTTRFTVVLQYHQALPVESLAVVVLELLHRNRASVVHSGYEAGTFYGKGHIVFGIRTQISIFVQNLNRNATQVFAICMNGTAVGAEPNLRRLARCPDFLLGHSLSFLAGNSLYRTRLILHAPHDVEIVFSLVAHTLRLSIHETLHFVGIVIICPQIYV